MLGRVRVGGHSMEPALHNGDELLFIRVPPRIGSVVVARDPRDPTGAAGGEAPCHGQARLVVKRVASIDGDDVTLESDCPDHETLRVDRRALIGRAILRYRPGFAWGLRPPAAPRG